MKTVDKPWGEEIWLVVTNKYVMKLLRIKKGHQFSLQYHEVKDEAWYVTKGKINMTKGHKKDILFPGDVVHISPGTIHRLKAIEDCEVFEVSTPELDDVVRIEDDYDRPKNDRG
ncbi:MAG: cupin domain-containing protein [bacterium]|nr:cupin domain-containing protein [bacterium]